MLHLSPKIQSRQYQVDNYLLFDPFNDNGTYTSNNSKIPIGRDFADLSNRPIILGNKFTMEVRIYSDQRGGQANYYQRILGGGPSLGKLGNPPHYDGKQSPPYIYTVGYGIRFNVWVRDRHIKFI